MYSRKIIFAGLLISAAAFSGCRTSLFGGGEAPQAQAPQQPAAPIVVDGTRTSYADVVEKTSPAVVRIEGEPLETTSFWVKRVHTVQQYRKVGDFWLAASSQTDADVRLFGPAHLSIDYEDYQVNRSLLASRDGEHHCAPRR
jgi:S1-C subfamily serine protease